MKVRFFEAYRSSVRLAKAVLIIEVSDFQSLYNKLDDPEVERLEWFHDPTQPQVLVCTKRTADAVWERKGVEIK